MGVAGDVREQVEGDLVAAAGEQHEDALGLLDRRPGWPSRHGAGRPRSRGRGPGVVAEPGGPAGDVDGHALDGGHSAAGSSWGSPTRTTPSAPSARTMRVSSANSRRRRRPGDRLEDAGAVVGVLVLQVASVPGTGACGQPVDGEHLRATTTRRRCRGRSGHRPADARCGRPGSPRSARRARRRQRRRVRGGSMGRCRPACEDIRPSEAGARPAGRRGPPSPRPADPRPRDEAVL